MTATADYILLPPSEVDATPMEGVCLKKLLSCRLKLLLLLIVAFLAVMFLILLGGNSHIHSRPKLIAKLPDTIKESHSESSVLKFSKAKNKSRNHKIDLNKGIQIFDDDVNIDDQSEEEMQRLPGSIIIGTKKAGTGALVKFLKMHPDVAIGDFELNFFDYPDTFSKGFEFYRSMMPLSRKGQITMEKTSNYFHHKEAEWRIHSMNSSIKLLLLVREPISRCVSDYLQRTLKDKTTKYPPFEDYIINVNTGKVNEKYAGLKPSLYYTHLKRWLKYFPMSQIHIIEADELVENPYKEVYKVEEFLKLPHKVTKDRFVFNKKKGFYCLMLDGEDGQRYEQCMSKGKGRKHPEIDPDVYKLLKEYFKTKNELFFNLIGRRFDW